MQDHLAAHCTAVLPRQETEIHTASQYITINSNSLTLEGSELLLSVRGGEQFRKKCCAQEILGKTNDSEEVYAHKKFKEYFSNVNSRVLFSLWAIYLRWIIKEQSYIIGAGWSGVWSKLSLEVYLISSYSMVILQPPCYNDSLYLERNPSLQRNSYQEKMEKQTSTRCKG